MVWSQNVELTRTATALGPSDPPCRNAVLATPPPRMGVVSSVETWSITVEAIVSPVRALVRTLFRFWSVGDEDGAMALSFLYLLFVRVTQLIRLSCRNQRRAIERLGRSVEEILEETGMTEDELAQLFDLRRALPE